MAQEEQSRERESAAETYRVTSGQRGSRLEVEGWKSLCHKRWQEAENEERRQPLISQPVYSTHSRNRREIEDNIPTFKMLNTDTNTNTFDIITYLLLEYSNGI